MEPFDIGWIPKGWKLGTPLRIIWAAPVWNIPTGEMVHCIYLDTPLEQYNDFVEEDAIIGLRFRGIEWPKVRLWKTWFEKGELQ